MGKDVFFPFLALKYYKIFHLVGWIDENPTFMLKVELQSRLKEGTIEYLSRLDDVKPAIADASVYVLLSIAYP